MRRFITCFVALALCFGLCAIATNETIITMSYLNSSVKPGLEEAISLPTAKMSAASDAAEKRAEAVLSSFSRNGVLSSVTERILSKLQMNWNYMNSAAGEMLLLTKDDVISGLCGTKLVLISGSADVINSSLINVTQGIEVKAQSAASKNNRYIIPETNGAGLRISSDTARVAVDGVYRVVSLRHNAQYFDLADALFKMDLFRGSNVGYELSRAATRTEGLVMLLRLLGEEDEALAYSGKHPFTDVDSWAEKYVAYAYYKGYTNGISKTKFGSSNMTTANHYATFLLRALGYNDANGDFKWDRAVEFTKKIGAITANEATMLGEGVFYRDKMVYLSYYTLSVKLKSGERTLLEKLIADGAVEDGAAKIAVNSISRPRL